MVGGRQWRWEEIKSPKIELKQRQDLVLFQVTLCYLYPHFNVEFSRPTRSLYAHDLLSLCISSIVPLHSYIHDLRLHPTGAKGIGPGKSRVGEAVNEEVQGFRALWRFVEAKSNKLRRKKPMTDSSALLIDVQNTELFGSPEFVGFAGRAQPCSCWKTCGALPWCSNYVTRWAEGRRGWKNDPKSTAKGRKTEKTTLKTTFFFCWFSPFFPSFSRFFFW